MSWYDFEATRGEARDTLLDPADLAWLEAKFLAENAEGKVTVIDTTAEDVAIDRIGRALEHLRHFADPFATETDSRHRPRHSAPGRAKRWRR